ncbi:MAG TPA: TonB-dependent receptor [Rhizomicrobium sp.]|nr:TonB-dependent receptor [Rhizomicrobium sp.]
MHRHSILSFSFLLSTALIGTSAIAADADNGVGTIVVTATRTPMPRERTGESVSVITGSDLQTQQTVALSDALGETPGLTVNRNGPMGQPTSIGIRGGETGQTLVLIDGVRINDPSGTDEGAILGDLLVNNIDRVEILRGPQSTLYGSDAIGGVINVLTRRGGETPVQLRASAEGGSFDTYRLNAAADGTVDNVDYGAAVNYLHTNGVSAADSRHGNPETDGYGNFGATGNARMHVSDQVSIDLRSYYVSARDDFDDGAVSFAPPYPPADSAAYNTNRLLAGYAGVNVDLFDGKFHNRLAAMGSKSGRKFFDSAFDTIHENAANKGDATRFEYQGIVDLSPSDQISFGAETQRLSFTGDFFSSFSAFDSHATGHSRINGYYAQGQTTLFDALTLTGGVRYDDDADFGHHTSLKLAGAWQIMDGTTLHANYGDGFKAPSLYELFSQFSSVRGPLRPEVAKGWEAGADQKFLNNRMRASLTYFERKATNLIDFTSCSTPQECTERPFGFYYNVGRTQSKGVEAEIAGAISDTLNLTANYTNMTSTDLATGLALQRRPHIQANAILTWAPTANWSVGTSVSHVGRRIDQYDNSTVPPTPFPNGGYTLANLFGEIDFERLAFYGRVENLFDTHYEPELGYGAAGRAFYIGVRATY